MNFFTKTLSKFLILTLPNIERYKNTPEDKIDKLPLWIIIDSIMQLLYFPIALFRYIRHRVKHRC